MSTGDSASPDDPRPGDSLREGRFAISGKLGEGGQATTFDAVDKRDGRRVTIKRFRVRGASSWKEVELAEREAKVLAQVTHPNLPVYVDHFEESGSLYLVTEHIEGKTVATLRERGPLSEDEVLRFLRDTARSLEYLHGRSPPLVHRDIKPSNVIRRPDGSFAIIDFGAVRDRLKVTGSTVVGTFGYMAPEQFQGRAMPASDVYAAGATAVAMLTGTEPEALPHKGLAIDVASALPNARPALVRALIAMLEPDPDRRASSIAPLLAGWPDAAPKGPREASTRDESKGPRADRARSDEPAAPSDWETDPAVQRGIEEAGEQVKRAAVEIGETLFRVVDEVAKSSGEDLRRDARHAAEAARRAIKEAKREIKAAKEQEREAIQRGRQKEHEAERRERMEERRARRAERRAAHPRGAPLGGPILLVVLLALSVAQLAVLLALRVVTPLVLYIVSALFFGSIPGRAIRSAARAVSAAGKRAVLAMGRAKDVVRGRAPVEVADTAVQVRVTSDAAADPHAATHVSTIRRDKDKEAPGARVPAGGSEPKARFAEPDIEVDVDEEAAAEEEVAAAQKRKS